MNLNPEVQFVGVWKPLGDEKFPLEARGGESSIAYGWYSLIHLFGNPMPGVVLSGWNFLEKDENGERYKIHIGIVAPDASGQLKLDTERFISDAQTYGSSSIVVGDFNQDGWDDIFLAAHTEVPVVPGSSTAFISAPSGRFEKITLKDSIAAHDAKLATYNGETVVITSTFDASDKTLFAAANPIYVYRSGKFETLTPVKYFYDIARTWPPDGSHEASGNDSVALAKFGKEGTHLLIRSDYEHWNYESSSRKFSDIAVFPFKNGEISSNTPLQRITPYLSTLEEYKDYEGGWGRGISHTYRIWAEDFNHDGSMDLMAAHSMWNPDRNDWPNALQLLQNNGVGEFSDLTSKLNPDMGFNTGELSYSPLFFDIDNSGIKSYLFSNHENSSLERQSNYVLLNDGTGRLHVALHEEFKAWSELVVRALDGNTELLKDARKTEWPWVNPPEFFAVPRLEGGIDFLVSFPAERVDPSPQMVLVLSHFKVGYDPRADFQKDVIISDRNSSLLMRTWAGNDHIYDTGANILGDTSIDGGLGLDFGHYSGQVSNYVIQVSSPTGSVVRSISAADGYFVSDSLKGVERLTFADASVALDIAGDAGQAYRIYKAAFNRTPDTGGLGYWIGQMDGGMDLLEVSARFIDSAEFKALYGSDPSNAEFLTKVYTNVLGRAPDQGGYDWWLNEMNTNPEKTKAKVLADFSESAENLEGTAAAVANGIVYEPWGG